MKKTLDKPIPLLFPTPVVVVSGINEEDKSLITVSWTGIINSIPPMLSISIRKNRYSHKIISKSKEFAVNIFDVNNLDIVKYIGRVSGKEVDKFAELDLMYSKGTETGTILLDKALVQIECSVVNILELGSHDMFIGEIKAVHVDKSLLDESGAIHPEYGDFISYVNGKYFLSNRKID